MTTSSLPVTRRIYRVISLPRIHIEIRRKDLWLSAAILLAGIILPVLMFFGVLAPNLFIIFLCTGLILVGGTLLLVRSGEIA